MFQKLLEDHKKDRGALLQAVISRIADKVPCQIKLHPLRHDEDIENFCKDLKIHPKILNRQNTNGEQG